MYIADQTAQPGSRLMNEIADLNKRFAVPDHLCFEPAPDGRALARIDNRHASAAVALQGSQLLAWQPNNADPVIWLSKAALFAPGKAIRGGAPVCWPWFGAHAEHNDWPAHGFARTAVWQVQECLGLDDGSTRLSLALPAAQIPSRLWPHPTSLQCRITVGDTLEIELVTQHQGQQPVTLSEALHTYFNVSDVRQISVTGLDGCDYLDKVDDFRRKRQAGAVTFAGEVDRIYLDSRADCLILDPGLARQIRISKQGSDSTVVWNPWTEKAARMGDLGEDGYLTMVCVESANAAENAVTLAPGDEHRLQLRYAVEPLGA